MTLDTGHWHGYDDKYTGKPGNGAWGPNLLGSDKQIDRWDASHGRGTALGYAQAQ